MMQTSISPFLTLLRSKAGLAIVGVGSLAFSSNLTSAPPPLAPERGPACLIATGWDSPSAARFRAELGAFEAWGVFDGTTLTPMRRLADGRVVDARNAFSADHWEWAEFADCVGDLKAAQPQQAIHNFLFLYANPGDVAYPFMLSVQGQWRETDRAFFDDARLVRIPE